MPQNIVQRKKQAKESQEGAIKQFICILKQIEENPIKPQKLDKRYKSKNLPQNSDFKAGRNGFTRTTKEENF